MGYDLAIGEACFDGDVAEAYMRVWAKPEQHEEAPSFVNDPLTGNSNMRSPGYSVWSDFCRQTGLYGMFFGLDGRRNPYMEPDPASHREVPIMADHPGYAVINRQDVDAIRAALDAHIQKHGDIAPGFRDWHEADEDAPANAIDCATRARLIWLHYWSDWAVRNCQWPVIANR
jgi:hypothetical protein